MILFQRMKTLTFPLITNLVEPELFSNGNLADLLKRLADDLITGVCSIEFSDGKYIMLLSSFGVPTVVYQVIDGFAQRMPATEWILGAELERGPFSYSSVSLSTQDLRKLRILFELDSRNVELSEKIKAISDAGKSNRPLLLASTTSNKLAMWYFPGSGAACRESLLMDREQVIHSPALDLFEQQSVGNDGVFCADSCEPNDAWVGYIQSQFFATVVLRFFSLLEQFKGRVLLNKVMRSFNFKAEANNWMISANARDINDQLFIEDPEQASAIYQQLMGVAQTVFLAEIGKPIMDGIILDSLAKTPETYWPMLRKMFDPVVG